MKLIVGLGNPGKEYEGTRHNCGFRAIDAYAEMAQVEFNHEDFKGVYAKFKLDGEDIILFKPQTFMNLSGEAVFAITSYFKIKNDDIVVVYDDMAIEPGELRLRLSGSSGGQKGIQNIIDLLKTENIKRIRVGIGEPKFNAIDYVLGKPSKEEKPLIDKAIENAAFAIREFLLKDFNAAMCKYNGGGKSWMKIC